MSSDPIMVPFLTAGSLAKRVLVRCSLPIHCLLTPPAPSLPAILREAGGSILIAQTRWKTWENVSHDGTGWRWGL